jgi:hypothetical protein
LLVAAAPAVLLVVTPPLFETGSELWTRRNDRLRRLVDRVAAISADRHVVWIADEAAYFFPCRTGFATKRYHAMSRADSDPAAVLQDLAGADSVVACVQDTALPSRHWQALEAGAAGTWTIRQLASPTGYRIYGMVRAGHGSMLPGASSSHP